MLIKMQTKYKEGRIIVKKETIEYANFLCGVLANGESKLSFDKSTHLGHTKTLKL